MENKQSKVWPPGFQSVLNPADCWDNFSVVSKHIIEAELPLLLNSQEELEAAEFAYRQHGWPALLAEAELFISGVVFRMWGSPLPDEFFATVEANPRPIMIASRKLMPLAYLELTKGLTASFRTIYGTGEFLYPLVLDAVATELELRKREEDRKGNGAAA